MTDCQYVLRPEIEINDEAGGVEEVNTPRPARLAGLGKASLSNGQRTDELDTLDRSD